MYKVVIGLEVHCELNTNSKNFSTAINTYSADHNENVEPVDLGLPGILPVANKEAIKKALKTAMALNCKNPDLIQFERKNYYYPDLPKGYQITQVAKPFGTDGYLMIILPDYEKKILIHQLHLEEDTASLEHLATYTLIDYNRAGIPLMEVVTEPCLSSADEAVAFLETLRSIFIYCGVSEAKSDKGQMRCDVNVSLMKESDTQLGTKVEMKNINSFNSVRLAIEYEIKRQSEILNNGQSVIQETRRFDDVTLKTCPMREKVDAVDYKYFTEPNIPPIKITTDYLATIKSEIPKLQYERYSQYTKEYELSKYDSIVLIKDKNISDYFEAVISFGISAKDACNLVTTVIIGTLNKLNISLDNLFITPKMLSDVIKLINENKLSLNNAKNILYQSIKDKVEPLVIIKESNIMQIDDDTTIINLVNEAMDNNPDVINQFKEGKEYVVNFFVGQLMKKTNGQVNPAKALDIIKQEIKKR